MSRYYFFRLVRIAHHYEVFLFFENLSSEDLYPCFHLKILHHFFYILNIKM